MYSHNYTYIKPEVPMSAVTKIIEAELLYRKSQNKDYLKIVYEGVLSSDYNHELQPEISTLDYYYLDVSEEVDFKYNPETVIKKTSNQEILEDGKRIDILANKDIMGEEFCIRRINRKAEVYKDPKALIDLYVIYYKNEVIGNVEYLAHGTLIKIEDFDIYEPYQQKGHGSSLIKFMIDKVRASGAEGIYLITYHDATAKYMYEKCGFKFVGQKTELLFNWNYTTWFKLIIRI